MGPSSIIHTVNIDTRMHSSRMRTVRNSSRLLPGGGGGGGLLPEGWYPSMHWGRPPVNRMTDRQV